MAKSAHCAGELVPAGTRCVVFRSLEEAQASGCLKQDGVRTAMYHLRVGLVLTWLQGKVRGVPPMSIRPLQQA